MLFRNISLFRFPASVSKRLKNLAKDLESRRLRACGPLELATHGFVSPYGRDSDALTHQSGRYTLFSLGGEERLLPGAVIREILAQRLTERATREGRRPASRERKRLKEEVISELLPHAFIVPSRVMAYVDTEDGWLIVDSASRPAAERMVHQLREALGRFPATPAAYRESPRTLMTTWLIHGKLPANLALGDECELRDPAESGAIVRCRRQDLESDEVREHLRSGKQVFQLGLCFHGRVEFLLGEDLTIRKLRFLDVVQDELDADNAESVQDDVAVRFALMTREQEQLLAGLDEWFGLPRPDDRD
ncbi:MAG: recombination-associated protein RdgC [Rhodanobacteraceae bacterium]